MPRVETIDAFWHQKQTPPAPAEPAYEAIEIPHNSPAGFITAFFAVVMGFSLIWHIWWLAILAFLAAATVVLIAGWSIEREHEISAAQVGQMELARRGEADRTAIATIDRPLTAVPTELARGRGGGGPASKRIVVAYGFWIFILSDMVMFSALFAAYAVLRGNTAGGPTGSELFNLRNVFIETMFLLLSSYTCGLGALSAEHRQPALFLRFAAFTFVLGAAFLFIEGTEFAEMVRKGAGPSRSGFLSAYFTLVGMHGVHVAGGLIALVYLAAQVIAKGLPAAVLRRLLCWSLFWHALDIVWVGVFTLVYLMGEHL